MSEALVSDELLNQPVMPEEIIPVADTLMARPDESVIHTIGSLAEVLGVKPMRVAKTISELRNGDKTLDALIEQNEFLIKKFGTARISAEAVAGDHRLMDKFWRNNDPLGVYRPGDMFYIDEKHKLMPYFPVLILVPAGLLALFPLLGMIQRLF